MEKSPVSRVLDKTTSANYLESHAGIAQLVTSMSEAVQNVGGAIQSIG